MDSFFRRQRSIGLEAKPEEDSAMPWLSCCKDRKSNKIYPVYPDENKAVKLLRTPDGKLGLSPRATSLVLGEREPNTSESQSSGTLAFTLEDGAEVTLAEDASGRFHSILESNALILPDLQDLGNSKVATAWSEAASSSFVLTQGSMHQCFQRCMRMCRQWPSG